MPNDLWINLPVRDLATSKKFFEQLGFPMNPGLEGNTEMAGMLFGEKQVAVMLFPESTFQQFAGQAIADTSQGAEHLISVGVDSPEEVDTIAGRVTEAGGVVFSPPQDIQSWMYGAGFYDLDGHRWNLLYMDMSKSPGGQ